MRYGPLTGYNPHYCHVSTGAPVSEEDVERVIETGQADNLFQQAFATEQVCGRAI